MKQLLQDARTGELTVTEVPAPQLVPGCVLVRTAASLVSAGTERASAEFARKNLLAKAKSRPDLVRDVLAKLRRDGLTATVGAVRSRLDQPQSVGYSSAGTLIAVGDGVSDLAVGDHVACAGTGYAAHAEIACIPRLLVAKIPASSPTNAIAGISEQRSTSLAASFPVSFEEAAFGTVGAICLHGIRTADGTRRLGGGNRSWASRSNHSAIAESCRLPRVWHGPGRRARLPGDSKRSQRSFGERRRISRFLFSADRRQRRRCGLDHGRDSVKCAGQSGC